jgi:23S rRNA pseudouridine1911/1915/1917 synthase
MERNYKLMVPDINPKVRIDKYIAGFIQNASRTKVQKSINLGNVTVNGNFIKSNYLVKPFDEIEIELPVPEKQDILPEDIPLNIVFEDNYLMVINKPAGMVTHPAYKNYSGTLVNAVMFYANSKNDRLSNLNGFERAGIVHRLDKDTSGLIVIAKDEVTHRKLSEQFFKHTIDREYIALVWGNFKNKNGIIEKKLARDKKDRKKVSVVNDEENYGKNAITLYEVINEFELLSLMKLTLKTGRTHQIRVHLSSIGHPVFGDETYGGRIAHSVNLTTKIKAKIKKLLDIIPRQALHAKVLGFTHPVSKERIKLESEIPDDIRNVISELKLL